MYSHSKTHGWNRNPTFSNSKFHHISISASLQKESGGQYSSKRKRKESSEGQRGIMEKGQGTRTGKRRGVKGEEAQVRGTGGEKKISAGPGQCRARRAEGMSCCNGRRGTPRMRMLEALAAA